MEPGRLMPGFPGRGSCTDRLTTTSYPRHRRSSRSTRMGGGGPTRGCAVPRPERPLDSDGGPVQRFAADLRRLRREAGNPGYRQLARRAHFSVTSLAEAAVPGVGGVPGGGRALVLRARPTCRRAHRAGGERPVPRTDAPTSTQPYPTRSAITSRNHEGGAGSRRAVSVLWLFTPPSDGSYSCVLWGIGKAGADYQEPTRWLRVTEGAGLTQLRVWTTPRPGAAE